MFSQYSCSLVLWYGDMWMVETGGRIFYLYSYYNWFMTSMVGYAQYEYFCATIISSLQDWNCIFRSNCIFINIISWIAQMYEWITTIDHGWWQFGTHFNTMTLMMDALINPEGSEGFWAARKISQGIKCYDIWRMIFGWLSRYQIICILFCGHIITTQE